MTRRVRFGTKRAAVILLLASSLAGCKVLTLEEDRAIRARGTQALDASRYVAEIWSTRLLPVFRQRAVPAARLLPTIDADLPRAGATIGRQAGEGSAWTFVTNGTGTVIAVDRASRRGTVDLAVDGLPTTRPLRLQVGPVVGGTTIRDAAPFITFNDFPDQLAFADVGRALNARALADVRRGGASLEAGTRVRFVGTFALAASEDAVVITPVVLLPEGPRAG